MAERHKSLPLESELINACRDEQDVSLDQPTTEDCIFLDVFIPKQFFDRKTDPLRCGNVRAPVVVTFGQASFTAGSKDVIDGAYVTFAPYVEENYFRQCGSEFHISVVVNYGPPEILPYDLRYPEPAVAGYNIIREIFMGCNAWALGQALLNSSYMFNSGNMKNLGMMGLYRDNSEAESNTFYMNGMGWKNSLLYFIQQGIPGPRGEWPIYGEERTVRKAIPFWAIATSLVGGEIEKEEERNMFDNERCKWWAEEGFVYYFEDLRRQQGRQLQATHLP
ncbi:hypothetical protein B0T14DRAFT_559745 [Immersiella caudata]|uniref:Uncharacterized protein n=1 Tax=Immersiella caudata TaxID=314043 RepID=A0AA40CBD2_9PEZI|nr:hypothetical protein B0T14DRAFT_559745 [Immersiella caudata]